jgi:hypothetical protein
MKVSVAHISKMASWIHLGAYQPNRTFHTELQEDDAESRPAKLLSKAPVPIDVDAKHHKSPIYDPTYAQSIFEWKRKSELLYITVFPNLAKGEIQQEITENMRIILLDWLTGISEEHHLSSNTYCLAVHLIDYALTLMPVKRSQFQLLGCTCIWLAAKLEEVCLPSMPHFTD